MGYPAEGADLPNSPEQRKSTVLLVEDEVLIRMAISDYLQECGFKTFEAGSAAEALAIVQSGMWPIDVVFTDIELRGVMDGLGLARWIRLNRPGLPVVLCSGDRMKSEEAKKLCETEPFFHKPYDFAEVVAQIRSLLASKTATS